MFISLLTVLGVCSCNDNEVGCGVVPMLKEEREYREQVGRMQVILAKSSESVERVICGIAQKIK